MQLRFKATMAVISALAFVLPTGCVGPASLVTPNVAPVASTCESSSMWTSSHTCLGLWEFRIDPTRETVTQVPLRAAGIHMNGLAFMEPPAGVALAIDHVVDFTSSVVTVDIAITHPYPGFDLSAAFDVCGTLITHGSKYFPFSTTIRFPDEGDLRLLNPDGLTRWWNPVEFPENAAKPQFGYIDGLLGKPHAVAGFDATLNGYKYFASDLADPEAPLSDLDPAMRGAFVPGTTCIRRYVIAYTPGSLVFNYAVDANWAPPIPDGPGIDIPDDFPSSANRPEAYRIELENLSNTLTYDSDTGDTSGSLAMSVYIYDWFEPGSNMVCAYAQNDEVMGMCNPIPAEVGDGYAVFNFDLPPFMLSSTDEFLLWVTVDNQTSGYQGALPGELQTMYYQFWYAATEE